MLKNTTEKTNELIRQTAKRIAGEIKFDIEFGMYDHFELLKSRLNYIVEKLYQIQYVVNAPTLTAGEITTLSENDYLTRE